MVPASRLPLKGSYLGVSDFGDWGSIVVNSGYIGMMENEMETTTWGLRFWGLRV